MYNEVVQTILTYLGGSSAIELQIAHLFASLMSIVAIALPILCLWFFIRYIFKLTWR